MLRRYDAIEFLIGKNQHEGQDPLLHEELLVYLDDIKLQIQDYIDMFLKPEKGEAKYFYLGNEQKLTGKQLYPIYYLVFVKRCSIRHQ